MEIFGLNDTFAWSHFVAQKYISGIFYDMAVIKAQNNSIWGSTGCSILVLSSPLPRELKRVTFDLWFSETSLKTEPKPVC
jgi:hypothetical protein